MADNGEVKIYIPKAHNPNVVVIGGGHGLATLLRGLKQFTANITAIVTVADDGGSSGMLREDLGMPPPGDIRNCIQALANTEPTMEQLLNYRFTDGSLAGQSFGNLFLAALNGISDSFDQAVARMGDVLAVTGRVLPVTNSNIRLEAEFEDDTTVLGESKIFYHKKQSDCRIRRVRLVPEHPAALPQSIRSIENADLIAIGPGSLYTSIIPNFLVDGIADAVATSRAVKVFICNIMTQEGETEGYTATDHIRELLAHSRRDLIEFCVANNGEVPEALLDKYQKEGAETIFVDPAEIETMGIQVIQDRLISADTQYARHNPYKLAKLLMDIYGEKARPGG